MRFYFFLLLVLPAVIFTVENGNPMVSFAEEDPIDDEADVEGEVEMEEVAGTGGEEESEGEKSHTSPDAETFLLFVKPTNSGGSQLELPAGVPVEFLVGFRNKGQDDFVLESLRASFRYPMDFNFYIQNFSAIAYNRKVSANQEATLVYSFVPSEAFSGRPFGLNINLQYSDGAGNAFHEAVYNETVQIIELEEGLNGETFFLYVFLIGVVILLLFIGQQTLLSVGKKRAPTRKVAPVETGTSNPNNVDYDWLPKSYQASLNKEKLEKSPKGHKSPKASKSPKQSPRQRKLRSTGSE